MIYPTRTAYPDALHSWYGDDNELYGWSGRDTWYPRQLSRTPWPRSAEPAFAERGSRHNSRDRSDTRSPRFEAGSSTIRSSESSLSDYDYWYSDADMRKDRKSRPKKYWARPTDGKRHGTLGRILDAFTGEGPDVFVVLTKSRQTLHDDLPHRGQWSGSEESFDDANHRERRRSAERDYAKYEPDRFERNGARRRGKYNFQTRKYESDSRHDRNMMGDGLWAGAHRPGCPRYGHVCPQAF